MRVLIAGCGYVGVALGSRLCAMGHQVWGLKRHPSDFGGGIVPIAADLTDEATLTGVPEALDAVVYCPSAGRSSDDTYRRVYVEGLENLCQLPVIRAAMPRLLFVSSTSVYGQEDGSWVTESSATEPARFSGVRTLEAERVALTSGYSAVVLRCGGIYGPGRRRLIDSVLSGSASYDPNRVSFTNRIHRDDVAGALLHLIDLPKPDAIYLGVDCLPAAREEVLTWLAARLGAPEPRKQPANETNSEAGSKRCSNARLLASGYRFVYPTFREGYSAMLAKE
jgi:nucleoside-diphosphate-sugar epimerase